MGSRLDPEVFPILSLRFHLGRDLGTTVLLKVFLLHSSESKRQYVYHGQ